MTDYTGAQCPACKAPFLYDDDIVVCHICGAAHHRACYDEHGKCVFTDEHITRKTRKPTSTRSRTMKYSQSPVRPPKSDDIHPNHKESDSAEPQEREGRAGSQRCTFCKKENFQTNIFCDQCGNLLSAGKTPPASGMGFGGLFSQPLQFDPLRAIYGGVSPNDTIDGHSASDVVAYVGKSANYYLPRFKSCSDMGKTIFSSFSALFLHGFYFLYRKMYALAAIMLAVFIVSSVPTVLFIRQYYDYISFAAVVSVGSDGFPLEAYDAEKMAKLEQYSAMSSSSSSIFFVISALVSLLSTRFYYSKSMKKLAKEKKKLPAELGRPGDSLSRERILAKAGGTAHSAVIVVACVAVVTALIALAVFIPA